VQVETGKISAPALARDARSGRLYASWVRASRVPGPFGGNLGDPFLASSADGGRTWSPARQLDTHGDVQSPQVLAVDKQGDVFDAWAAYRANKATPFGEFNYRLARSQDGSTFAVDNVTDGGIQQVSRPNLYAAPSGRVWAAWLDGRPIDRKSTDPLYTVNIAVSRDRGQRFTPGWPIKGNACNCCRPALAERPGHPNTVAAIWRDVVQQPGTEDHNMQMDHMNPNGSANPHLVYPKTDVRNIKIAISTDGGHDFGSTVAVGDFGWRIQACPTIGPAVWWNHDGRKLRVAFFTGATGHQGVYFAESADAGKHFSAPFKLTGDIVGEGYDLAVASGPGDSSYVGWATPDKHVQAARVDSDGTVHTTPKLEGDRVALTTAGRGALLSYATPKAIVVRSLDG
jgi:hypothetical protein